ncbi:MAG: DUF6270 domain-containing protein, partial [Pseudoclavibacter sp.]
SIGSNAWPHLPTRFDTSHRFQRTNIEADAVGNVERVVRRIAPATDVLLWDLTDERHGVFRFDDGATVTRSVDVLAVPELVEATSGAELVEFGDDAHFAEWARRAAAFTELLVEVDLLDRTLVLAVDWAERDSVGAPTPSSMGMSAREANAAFPRYYGLLELLGLEVLRIPAVEAIADVDHKWGVAPFHYVPEVYDRIRASVEAFARHGL